MTSNFTRRVLRLTAALRPSSPPLAAVVPAVPAQVRADLAHLGHTITVEMRDGAPAVIERAHGRLVKVCSSGVELQGLSPESAARAVAALYGAVYVPTGETR